MVNNEILHDVLLNLMYVLLVSVSTEVCSVGNYTNWGRVFLIFHIIPPQSGTHMNNSTKFVYNPKKTVCGL
jgi:hypothetical protein